ncbi:MAG: TetR/AcrR family transcriptional regulator [Actinomycetota bacterium]
MKTAQARRPRAKRGEGDKLRGDILDVAERMLVEAGNEDAVSIRAIAKAVGCTPPAIYLHFADKDQLFFEVCARRFQEFDRAVFEEGDAVDDPLESLRLSGKAYIRFGLEHPEHYKLLMMVPKTKLAEELGPDAPGMAAFQHLVDTVQRCLDAGVISEDHGATNVAVALWSACHGITALLITFTNFEHFVEGNNVEGLVDLLLDVQLEGLLAI